MPIVNVDGSAPARSRVARTRHRPRGRAWLVATGTLLATLLVTGPLSAAVTADQAAQLRGALTPAGAQRAGNADGTIPAWTGGITSTAQARAMVQVLARERPVFSITSSNYREYADRLPQGALALFARDADYRMDIYPTHRTGGYGPSITAAIARNAVSAMPAPRGCAFGVVNASGGIPFPIPADGCEAMWNHVLGYWGDARTTHLQTFVVFGGNDIEKTSERDEIADFPYYQAGLDPAAVGPYYFERRDLFTYPADRAGGGYITSQPIDISRTKFASWEYLAGQRRVRKSPSLSYDTPNPDASGLESFDDYYVFSGGLDRYRYQLLGKREMYVPYNNHSGDIETRTLLGGRHANPDSIRYERHRVWVVDATLAPGQSHVVPHRRFYLDEDTWFAIYADAWNTDGRLWKYTQGMMDLMPDIPAVVLGSQLVYDLLYHSYLYDFSYGRPGGDFRLSAPHPQSAYTPEGMAADFDR